LKILVTNVSCRAYRALENPNLNPYVVLPFGTILLGDIMQEFEKQLADKFVFVISPDGEALFLATRDVREMQDTSVR